MYRHILIPSDGSELAGRAVRHGLSLAKSLGAKVTALTVEGSFDVYTVPASRIYAMSGAFAEHAEQRGCDLIVMASHGRSGLAAIVLGSVTTKVLTHTKVPVLVCH